MNEFPELPPTWKEALAPFLTSGWNEDLKDHLSGVCPEEIFPPQHLWFKAFGIAPKDAKVVILGQDPYHGPGQANGLAFSVNPGQRIPPSLRNIVKQARSEGFGCQQASTGDLGHWHDQGVMLLNTCLTVSKAQAGSHHGWGWETLTDAVVRALSDAPGHRVFMLWGAPSRKKRGFIHPRHLTLESAHPSPLSAYRGFLGNGHFAAANRFLESKKLTPIQW